MDLFWWLSAGDVSFDKADCGLSTTESEYISIKDVAHALEIRSAVAERTAHDAKR